MAGSPQQKRDESCSFGPRCALIAEEFFELVHQDEQPGSSGQRLDAKTPVQRQVSPAQILLQVGDGLVCVPVAAAEITPPFSILHQ